MGMSKGGIPGAGNLTVAIFALVLEDALGPVGVPLSVGLLLPVLMLMLRPLAFIDGMPTGNISSDYSPVLMGTILGWLVFDYFQGGDDRVKQLKVLIGVILLSMTLLDSFYSFVKIKLKKASLQIKRYLD